MLVLNKHLSLWLAVFILETDNPSRWIIRLLFYVCSINTGRNPTRTESAYVSSSSIYTRRITGRINSQSKYVCRKGVGTSQNPSSLGGLFVLAANFKMATVAQFFRLDFFSRSNSPTNCSDIRASSNASFMCKLSITDFNRGKAEYQKNNL